MKLEDTATLKPVKDIPNKQKIIISATVCTQL